MYFSAVIAWSAGVDVRICHIFSHQIFERTGFQLRRFEAKVGVERQRQDGHSCDVCHGLSCRACGEGCLHYTPSALRCAGACNSLIRRGSLYHYNEKEDAELCQRCFKVSGAHYRISALSKRMP